MSAGVCVSNKTHLDLYKVSNEQLIEVLKLFIRSIRKIRMTGDVVFDNGVSYYEVNLRNSGVFLSGLSQGINNDRMIHYFISCSSNETGGVREFIHFECDNKRATVTAVSEDIGTLYDACRFMHTDYGNMLRKIEFYEE